MLASNLERVRRGANVAAAAFSVLAIAACAASTGMQAGTDPGAISDVEVESAEYGTTVSLLGVMDPIFTAFAQEDPARIVVDLADVASDRVWDPVTVGDGLVEQVILSPYASGGEELVRVEVALAAPADYRVVPSDGGLSIVVVPLGADRAAETVEDPWGVTPASTGETADPAESVEWKPATKLTRVEVRQEGEGSLVHLVADGAIEQVETFTLESPDRLVIDLPGLAKQTAQDRVAGDTPQAKQVRIGEHADMIRVVIDAGEAAAGFQSRRVVPAASGLVVALGSGEELEWAVQQAAGSAPMRAASETAAEEMPAAWDPAADAAAADAEMAASEEMPLDGEMPADPETAAADEPMAETWPEEPAEPTVAPAKAAGPVLIYGVEYDVEGDRDRVVIMGEQPVDYLLYEPQPDTVVLSIQNAKIDPEAAVRITPEPGGPVSLVTAFEQPETRGTEVRVVMKRAPNLKPQVSRRGSIVVVDFPRDGSMAAPPPVLSADAAAPGAMPAGNTPAAAASSPAAMPVAGTLPAAPTPVASIDVLQEGGLMDGKQYLGRRISLDFKDIEMADVLRLIAEVSDLNVIAGEEVAGRVTIRLVDVPWDQALDVILLTKGLGFMRVGNVLRIAPSEILKQEEEMRLQERRALEQLEDLVVKLQPVNYAQVGDVKSMVSRLLSSRGTVDIDKRTNTLILKDIPSVIDEATALIKAIDTQTPQVLIESKIVEANLDFSREFGVTWGFGAQPLNDAFDSSSGNRSDLGSDAFRLNTVGSGPLGVSNNAIFSNPLTAGPTALFNIAGFILDEKLNLDLQLQAAEINGDGKVISSPRVVTLDNTKATIEQGVSIPFQTFENGDAQLEFVDAVLKLDVTPHVTADRSIIMQVKVSRNAPDDSVFTLTGSPAIAKNQVDTETLVKDGQTLVIGGIYVIDKSQRQSRVPFLHSIPLIGTLFRSDEVSDARKELLIFVTPRVVATVPSAS